MQWEFKELTRATIYTLLVPQKFTFWGWLPPRESPQFWGGWGSQMVSFLGLPFFQKRQGLWFYYLKNGRAAEMIFPQLALFFTWIFSKINVRYSTFSCGHRVDTGASQSLRFVHNVSKHREGYFAKVTKLLVYWLVRGDGEWVYLFRFRNRQKEQT